MVEFGDVLSKFGLGSINTKALLNKFLFWALIVGAIIIIGAVFGALLYFRNQKQKKLNANNNLIWWEEINSKLTPRNLKNPDQAEELIISGTMMRLFYVQEKDLYLPRFSEAVDKGVFFICITPKGRMINFTLSLLTPTLKEANLDFDRRDDIWASENMREWIKRNYRDKSVKWWQAYQQVITTALFILIMTFSLVIIIYMLRGFVEDLGTAVQGINEAVKILKLNSPPPSGLITT